MKLKSLLISSLFAGQIYGAACCGGSSQIPSLITTDDRMQWAVSLSNSSVLSDVSSSGAVSQRQPADAEARQTGQIDGATLLSDRWQLGVSLPVQRRWRLNADTSNGAIGLADISLSVAYEAIPEMSYSAWRPRGFVYFQTRFPTGRNRFELGNSLDVRGSGFFEVAAGAFLLKAWSEFDANLAFEIRQPLARNFSGNDGRSSFYAPSLGVAAVFGVGWSPGGGAFRLGATFNATQIGAISISGVTEDESPGVSLVSTALTASYLWNDAWSSSVTYSDGSILNLSRNTTNNRVVNFLVQHRFPR